MTSYEIEYTVKGQWHKRTETAKDLACEIARSIDRNRDCAVSGVVQVVDENGRKPQRSPVEWEAQ